MNSTILELLLSPQAALMSYGQERGITFEGGAGPDKKLLLFALVYILGAKLVYETGFNAGGTASAMAESLKLTRGKYVGFEIAEKRVPVIEEFHRRYPGHEVVMGNSAVTLPARWEATRETPDLFFVDGDHSEHGALKDMEHAKKIVRPGGVIMVDDVNDPGIRRAINRAFEPSKIMWFDNEQVNGPGSCVYQVE
jgi:predicted O-methyltransferase YrrM